MIARTAIRSFSSALRPATRALPRVSALARPQTRLISSSLPRFEPSPLSLKLAEEIKYETENSDQSEPDFLREFRSEGVWKVKDEPGSDEITLTRTFGSEDIRLIFSISDIDAEADINELASEEESAVADAEVPADELGPVAVETQIVVSKSSGGALTIDAVAEAGSFLINNIAFYPDADVALGMKAEDDWKRQGLYMGPAFDNLDEGVQSEFENFLEERGVNSALALIIPDLAEWKEQKEYVAWLKGTQQFLEQ
ncbi:Mam33p [Sporobolomyces koalae]|uniref:Mam33p n=1 Tax=Sporobolomyces koalae TaxID=500713 RepID=UPI003180F5D9